MLICIYICTYVYELIGRLPSVAHSLVIVVVSYQSTYYCFLLPRAAAFPALQPIVVLVFVVVVVIISIKKSLVITFCMTTISSSTSVATKGLSHACCICSDNNQWLWIWQ